MIEFDKGLVYSLLIILIFQFPGIMLNYYFSIIAAIV